MKLEQIKAVYFVGIGGIGMSAIAEMLDDLGLSVQGSDSKESANTIRVIGRTEVIASFSFSANSFF